MFWGGGEGGGVPSHEGSWNGKGAELAALGLRCGDARVGGRD